MTTLLAVTGLSPAVVTETLWALAKRRPRVVPERVRFITTATGARYLEDALFKPLPEWNDRTVWDCLRRALRVGEGRLVADDPVVVQAPDEATGRMKPLADLTTPTHNEHAASLIFEEVSRIARDKDQRLIASIAGGRKTMGALLHASLSLVGRESDLLTHVLVSPPFDTIRDFYFPAQPGGNVRYPNGDAYSPADARIHLAEIPFVPLRNRFRDLDDFPGSFLGVRDEFSEILRDDAERSSVELIIEHQRGSLTVADKTFRIRPRALAVLEFILERNKEASVPRDQKEAAELFAAWFATHCKRLGAFDPGTGFDETDIKRELSFIRTRLDKSRAPWKPAKGTLHQPAFTLKVK